MTDTASYTLTDEERGRGIFVTMMQVPKPERCVARQRIEEVVDAHWRNDRHAIHVFVHAAYCGRLEEYVTKLEQHLRQQPGETNMFFATCYLDLGIRPKIKPADRPEPRYWRLYTAFCNAFCRDRAKTPFKESWS